MADYILLVDDTDEILPVLDQALEGAALKVAQAESFAAAKRRLVQAIPLCIIAPVATGAEPNAGIRFCSDLKTHPELSRVPVLLIATESTEELRQSVLEAGARELIPWPVSSMALRAKVQQYFPAGLSRGGSAPQPASEPSTPPPAEPAAPQPAAPQPATRQPAAPAPSTAQPGAQPDAKLQLVQRLLAQVLHSLKTSDLLQIVEVDDVPRVVMEMTKKVCEESAGRTERPTPAEESPAETKLDLEKAFRFKK